MVTTIQYVVVFKQRFFSGASGNSQAFTGTARSPGALFLTVSEGGTKPKKLKIFPLPHKTPLKSNHFLKKPLSALISTSVCLREDSTKNRDGPELLGQPDSRLRVGRGGQHVVKFRVPSQQPPRAYSTLPTPDQID